MSARAIIARRLDDGFKGVYHDDDPSPWSLGNALLFDLLDQTGDLGRLVRTVVDDAPGGWRSYPERTAARGRRTAFVGPDALEFATTIEWLYLFTVEERVLEIWLAPTPDLTRPPAYRLVFDSAGYAEPPLLGEPPPSSPRIRILSDDDGDFPADRALRARIDEHLPSEHRRSVRNAFEEGFRRVLSNATWTSYAEGPYQQRLRERLRQPPPPKLKLWDDAKTLRCIRPDDEAGRRDYWWLDLGEFRVEYPCPSDRDDDDVGADYVVLRNDAAFAVVPPLLSLFPYSEGSSATDRLFEAGAKAIGGPEVAFGAVDEEAFIFKRVVNRVTEHQREIALADARDIEPECRLGETLGWNIPPFGGLWTVLDWLRSH